MLNPSIVIQPGLLSAMRKYFPFLFYVSLQLSKCYLSVYLCIKFILVSVLCQDVGELDMIWKGRNGLLLVEPPRQFPML